MYPAEGKVFFLRPVIKVPRYAIFQEITTRLEVYALESDRYNLEKLDRNWH